MKSGKPRLEKKEPSDGLLNILKVWERLLQLNSKNTLQIKKLLILCITRIIVMTLLIKYSIKSEVMTVKYGWKIMIRMHI